jgi:hypothetical protein
MRDIRISPTAQLAAILAVVVVIGLAIVAQLPELQRYLKLRSM